MSKFPVKFEGNKLLAGLDSNQDGENSVSVEVTMSESLQEVMSLLKKGEGAGEVEVNAKKVRFVANGTKLQLLVDTDQDGEESIKVEIDILESVDEASDAVSKE